MNTTTNKKVSKMSDTMIFCELRSAWAEVEMNVRHGSEPCSRRLGDYIAALEAEKARRAR